MEIEEQRREEDMRMIGNRITLKTITPRIYTQKRRKKRRNHSVFYLPTLWYLKYMPSGHIAAIASACAFGTPIRINSANRVSCEM